MKNLKDCQALMLLEREYKKGDQSLFYKCKNNMGMHVAVDNISADRIAELDKIALESIRTQECFKCPYHRMSKELIPKIENNILDCQTKAMDKEPLFIDMTSIIPEGALVSEKTIVGILNSDGIIEIQ